MAAKDKLHSWQEPSDCKILASDPQNIFTESEVRTALLLAIEFEGSQQAFAKATGFSKQYINNVVRQHRSTTISDALANALGFTRQVSYVRQSIDSVSHKKGGPKAALPKST